MLKIPPRVSPPKTRLLTGSFCLCRRCLAIGLSQLKQDPEDHSSDDAAQDDQLPSTSSAATIVDSGPTTDVADVIRSKEVGGLDAEGGKSGCDTAATATDKPPRPSLSTPSSPPGSRAQYSSSSQQQQQQQQRHPALNSHAPSTPRSASASIDYASTPSANPYFSRPMVPSPVLRQSSPRVALSPTVADPDFHLVVAESKDEDSCIEEKIADNDHATAGTGYSSFHRNIFPSDSGSRGDAEPGHRREREDAEGKNSRGRIQKGDKQEGGVNHPGGSSGGGGSGGDNRNGAVSRGDMHGAASTADTRRWRGPSFPWRLDGAKAPGQSPPDAQLSSSLLNTPDDEAGAAESDAGAHQTVSPIVARSAPLVEVTNTGGDPPTASRVGEPIGEETARISGTERIRAGNVSTEGEAAAAEGAAGAASSPSAAATSVASPIDSTTAEVGAPAPASPVSWAPSRPGATAESATAAETTAATAGGTAARFPPERTSRTATGSDGAERVTRRATITGVSPRGGGRGGGDGRGEGGRGGVDVPFARRQRTATAIAEEVARWGLPAFRPALAGHEAREWGYGAYGGGSGEAGTGNTRNMHSSRGGTAWGTGGEAGRRDPWLDGDATPDRNAGKRPCDMGFGRGEDDFGTVETLFVGDIRMRQRLRTCLAS